MKYAVRKISTVAFGEMKDFFEETQYSEFFPQVSIWSLQFSKLVIKFPISLKKLPMDKNSIS